MLNCQEALVPLHNSRATLPPAPVSLELIINCELVLLFEDAPNPAPIHAFLLMAKPPDDTKVAAVDEVASVVPLTVKLLVSVARPAPSIESV